MTKKQGGFSLIELSVVMVIIGLMIGGIFAGQSLIRSSELRSIVTEKERFEGAIVAFKDIYQALPGDMKNATSIWGAAHATPATCITTASAGTPTCNGNGDGRISYCETGNAQIYEAFTFWKHLSNAGLLGGVYSGVSGTASTEDSKVNINVPPSKYEGAGWDIVYMDNYWAATCDTTYIPTPSTQYKNTFFFGAKSPDGRHESPILSANDAKGIDQKIDDGQPRNGAAHNNPTTASGCVSGSAYAPTSSGMSCSFIFLAY